MYGSKTRRIESAARFQLANLIRVVNIRKAGPSDADVIAAVVNEAFVVENEMRDGRPRTSAENIRELMQRSTFFVAEQDGRIVGAVLVRVNGPAGYFGMLGVKPAVQRAGVGRALRERAEAFCKQHGCTEMTLSTGDFRRQLPPYYERAGYRITAIEVAPPDSGFTKPFNIVRMSKPL